MPDTPHQQKLHDITTQRVTLDKRLSRLQQQYDLETRVEEQMRLEPLIAETRKALSVSLQQEANDRKRKGAYSEAIALWREAQHYGTPSDSAVQEITAIETLAAQTNKITTLNKNLSRIREIRPIFKELATALNQYADTAEYATLLEQTEFFLDTPTPDTEGFLLWWENERPKIHTSAQHVDMAKMAGRVQRGEMVLFLGSGIACADDTEQEAQLVQQLAQQIGYDRFSGTLSSIAEYYQLHPDFGQSALLENLRTRLPAQAQHVLLYHALARVPAPLILISSAYDNLLEGVFRDAGKRFVELASIVRRSDEYDIGHVLVSFSDGSQPDKAYQEEEISRLKLFENGYSIIYKIRGTYGQDELRHDSLTLSESNFFSFARYADKMIPGYLACQVPIDHILSFCHSLSA